MCIYMYMGVLQQLGESYVVLYGLLRCCNHHNPEFVMAFESKNNHGAATLQNTFTGLLLSNLSDVNKEIRLFTIYP